MTVEFGVIHPLVGMNAFMIKVVREEMLFATFGVRRSTLMTPNSSSSCGARLR
jgi:hypothetical protein